MVKPFWILRIQPQKLGVSVKSLDGWVFNVISLIVLAVCFSSCTLEKQYHSSGYSVSWNAANFKRASAHTTQGQNISEYTVSGKSFGGAAVEAKSKSNFLKTNAAKNTNSLNRYEDSAMNPENRKLLELYGRMDVPMDWLKNYSRQELLMPYFRHDSIVRPHKIITVYMRNKAVVGKLMGISESGVFIWNNKKTMSLFAKSKGAQEQEEILGKLYYIPYNEISAIQKGGTFMYKLQRLLTPFYQSLSLLIAFALSIFAMAVALRANGGNNLSGEGLGILLAIFFVIGMVVAVAVCFLIALVLAPPIWLIHQLFWGIPGRYWKIKGDSNRGEEFFYAMVKSPRKLKIFRKK